MENKIEINTRNIERAIKKQAKIDSKDEDVLLVSLNGKRYTIDKILSEIHKQTKFGKIATQTFVDLITNSYIRSLGQKKIQR